MTAEEAKQILGPDYIGLMDYFIDLYSRCLQSDNPNYFVIFMTRRCHVLEEVFARLLLDEELPAAYRQLSANCPSLKKSSHNQLAERLKRIRSEHFITDTALSAMPVELVKAYENGCFPRLILCDELLIHGRAVNRMLLNLENDLLSVYHSDHCDLQNRNGSESDFLDHIRTDTELYIYSVNKEKLLLLNPFKENLTYRNLLPPEKWREFSMRLARLISVSDVANLAYSWSVRRKRTNTIPGPVCDSFRVHHYETPKTGKPTTLANYFYPDTRSVKAVGNIRRIVCKSQEQELLIPYTIYDKLNWNDCLSVHRLILEEIKRAGEDFRLLGEWFSFYDKNIESLPEHWMVYLRWICETNDLALNLLLLRQYFKQVEGEEPSPEELEEQIEFSRISRNFITLEKFDTGDKVELALRQLCRLPFSRGLQEYLSVLLQNTPAIEEELLQFGGGIPLEWNSDREEMKNAQQSLIFAVEDAIADIGYGSERNAFLNTEGQSTLSPEILAEWGEHFSISTFLKKLGREYIPWYPAFEKVSIDLSDITAVLVACMDYAYVGMNNIFSKKPEAYCDDPQNRTLELYTEIRAGEQALFIWPQKYHNLLEILRRLEPNEKDYSNVRFILHHFIQSIKQQRAEGKWFCAPEDAFDHLDIWNENQAGKIEEALNKFYRRVIESGQQFSEWEFISDVYTDMGYNCNSLPLENNTKLAVTLACVKQRLADISLRSDYLETYYNV